MANLGKCLTTYAKMKYGAGKDNIYKVVNDTKKTAKRVSFFKNFKQLKSKSFLIVFRATTIRVSLS